jgi:hypothetical protein
MINSMAAAVDPNKKGLIKDVKKDIINQPSTISLSETPSNSKPALPETKLTITEEKSVTPNSDTTNNNNATEAKPAANNNTTEAKPAANNNATEAKPAANNNAAEAKPAANNNATEAKPAANNNASEAKPAANNTTEAKPAANNNTNVKKTANNNTNTSSNGANNEKSPNKPFFHLTQKEFWGGPNASYSITQFLSIFPLTGLLGLDHYYLRSPLSGLLKMIVNMLTFGMWYLYDAAQVVGEEELVRKNGLSYPLIGSLGLGAGIFTGGSNNSNQKGGGDNNKKSGSPLMFLLYCICVLVPLPFALDHFIVGDTKGGIMKLIMNFGVGFPMIFFGGFFLIFFAIFWGLISVFRLYFQTEDVLNKGIVRVFPATIFMDKYFCTKLGPDPDCGGEAEESKGFLSVIMDSFKSLSSSFNQIPIVGKFASAATTAASAATSAATTVASTAATTASGFATAGMTAAALGPKIGSEVLQETAKLGNPDQYISKNKQLGGGVNQSDAGPIIFIALAVTAAIGVFMAKFRNLDTIDVLPRSVPTLIRSVLGTKRSWFPSDFNDDPPVPGAV